MDKTKHTVKWVHTALYITAPPFLKASEIEVLLVFVTTHA